MYLVILGWSPKIFDIISELIIANENQRNSSIVILTSKDRSEVQYMIKNKINNSKNTRIIYRNGDPMSVCIHFYQQCRISRNLEIRYLRRKICSHLQISGYVTLLIFNPLFGRITVLETFDLRFLFRNPVDYKHSLKEYFPSNLGMSGVSDNTENTDTFDTDKEFSVHR